MCKTRKVKDILNELEVVSETYKELKKYREELGNKTPNSITVTVNSSRDYPFRNKCEVKMTKVAILTLSAIDDISRKEQEECNKRIKELIEELKVADLNELS